MSFQDRLAAAKAAPKASMVVEVVMNSAVDTQLAELEEQLKQAEVEFNSDQRLGAVSPAVAIQEQIDALAEGAPLERIRVYQMDSDAWGELVSLHPPRSSVTADVRFGYNTYEIAKPAAKQCAVVIDEDDEITLTSEEWDDLFKVTPRLPSQIANALFSLNVWEPAEAVERAKKAFARRAASEQKSN